MRGSRVLLVGVSYKKDLGDVRESPALKVMELLHRKGAELSYHDPHVPVCQNGKGPICSVGLEEAAISAADCVVILTDHSGIPYERILRSARVIVDTRNVLRDYNTPRVLRLWHRPIPERSAAPEDAGTDQ